MSKTQLLLFPLLEPCLLHLSWCQFPLSGGSGPKPSLLLDWSLSHSHTLIIYMKSWWICLQNLTRSHHFSPPHSLTGLTVLFGPHCLFSTRQPGWPCWRIRQIVSLLCSKSPLPSKYTKPSQWPTEPCGTKVLLLSDLLVSSAQPPGAQRRWATAAQPGALASATPGTLPPWGLYAGCSPYLKYRPGPPLHLLQSLLQNYLLRKADPACWVSQGSPTPSSPPHPTSLPHFPHRTWRIRLHNFLLCNLHCSLPVCPTWNWAPWG